MLHLIQELTTLKHKLYFCGLYFSIVTSGTSVNCRMEFCLFCQEAIVLVFLTTVLNSCVLDINYHLWEDIKIFLRK